MPEPDNTYNIVEIRFAQACDRGFWFTLDRHLAPDMYDRKLRDKEAYVLTVDGEPVGILRYNLFWDNLPFCTLLYVKTSAQRRGYGTMLMKRWEEDMRAAGFGMVLTSTQADETAQHFYRKLGYADCGGLTPLVPGYGQPMEIFLCKAI